MWELDAMNSGRHEAVPAWTPRVGSTPDRPRGSDLRGCIAGWLRPHGAQELVADAEVDAWFRRHWYGPAPIVTGQFRHAFVATMQSSEFSTLVVVGPRVRAVYLAAWIGDTTVAPSRIAPFVVAFEELGCCVSIDDGGLIAELDVSDHDPVQDAANAVRVAELMSELATELAAISSLALAG